MIIAVDYDETITDNTPFPQMGNIRPEARRFLKLLYERGFTLVLYTCRSGLYYDECVQRLKEECLYQYFDFNYPIPEHGKLEADYYIDDRATIGEISWEKWYNYIVGKEEKNG